MSRHAIIDLGTNSALLLIIELNGTPYSINPPFPPLSKENQEQSLGFNVLKDEAAICRLGEGLHQHDYLSDAAQNRTLHVLHEFKTLCDTYHVKDVTLVGTEACRRAKNIETFQTRIAQELGWRLVVLSGSDEAALSYQAAIANHPLTDPETIVVDPGGGSTEFIMKGTSINPTSINPPYPPFLKGEKDLGSFSKGNEDTDLRSCSLQLGSVVLTERYISSDPPTHDDYLAMRRAIESTLTPALTSFPSGKPMILLAGTATTLAAIHLALDPYDGERVSKHCFTAASIVSLRKKLWSLSLSERETVIGLHPKRAHVILGGSLLVECIIEALNPSLICVSDRGVRYGIAARLRSARALIKRIGV